MILTREEFEAFIDGTTNVMPDWTARVLAHDAAMRAELAKATAENERLRVDNECLRMTEMPVGYTAAPSEEWAALKARADAAVAEVAALKKSAEIAYRALGGK